MVTKILAKRLAKALPTLIFKFLGAFVKDHSIIDVSMIDIDFLHHINARSTTNIAIKLDIKRHLIELNDLISTISCLDGIFQLTSLN